MKTLTLTISDEVAAELAKAAAGGRHSAKEIAAHVVEAAFAPDWFDELDAEDRAGVEEGLAQAERGEFATNAEVDEAFARFRR